MATEFMTTLQDKLSKFMTPKCGNGGCQKKSIHAISMSQQGFRQSHQNKGQRADLYGVTDLCGNPIGYHRSRQPERLGE